MVNSALSKLAAFAVSLISLAIAYKTFGFVYWEIYAFTGGASLFVVITAIIGKIFRSCNSPGIVYFGVFDNVCDDFRISLFCYSHVYNRFIPSCNPFNSLFRRRLLNEVSIFKIGERHTREERIP